MFRLRRLLFLLLELVQNAKHSRRPSLSERIVLILPVDAKLDHRAGNFGPDSGEHAHRFRAAALPASFQHRIGGVGIDQLDARDVDDDAARSTGLDPFEQLFGHLGGTLQIERALRSAEAGCLPQISTMGVEAHESLAADAQSSRFALAAPVRTLHFGDVLLVLLPR